MWPAKTWCTCCLALASTGIDLPKLADTGRWLARLLGRENRQQSGQGHGFTNASASGERDLDALRSALQHTRDALAREQASYQTLFDEVQRDKTLFRPACRNSH